MASPNQTAFGRLNVVSFGSTNVSCKIVMHCEEYMYVKSKEYIASHPQKNFSSLL